MAILAAAQARLGCPALCEDILGHTRNLHSLWQRRRRPILLLLLALLAVAAFRLCLGTQAEVFIMTGPLCERVESQLHSIQSLLGGLVNFITFVHLIQPARTCGP